MNWTLEEAASAMAKAARKHKTLKDAKQSMESMLRYFVKLELEAQQRRVREVLGIPEGVPCCGD